MTPIKTNCDERRARMARTDDEGAADSRMDAVTHSQHPWSEPPGRSQAR
jgi:hypothetical protein